jgi:demethylmenaquinone methyltransferase/2-methoxy-6-polyprenyl-1,4-benzoquinol methylase
VKAYYDRRAPEYDDWYEGAGRFAGVRRPGWHEELAALAGALRALRPGRTLDVACGTAYATRWLPGDVTGLDQSAAMLAVASRRLPGATFVQGDALELPFAGDDFERVTTMSFYGHLEPVERERFLAEARRVAPELVVVDAALRNDVEPEERQERVLEDGSRWCVLERYFTGDGVLGELGGGDILHAGRWFVAVRSPRG